MASFVLKQKLSERQLAIVQGEFFKKKRDTFITFILWLGCCFFLHGLHQFYLKNYAKGLFRLFTLGGLGILTIYDIITLGMQINSSNEEIEAEIVKEILQFETKE